MLVHAALLRIDAISARYGVVSSPPWLAAVQTRTIAPPLSIRRASLAWYPEPMFPHADGKETRYRSDPYIYLEAARTMTSFYRAHFREPVFPFVTRGFLRLLDDQDVAVSFASAFFSIGAVWLTYMLGAALWSRPVGLLAALGVSLDYDVITQASGGWRDDAYMAMVTLCAYLLLRWWRTARAEPRVVRLGTLRMDAMYLPAALFGIAGGFAILTRIMAVSFWSRRLPALCSRGEPRGGATSRRRGWRSPRRRWSPLRISSTAGVCTAILSTPSTCTDAFTASPKPRRTFREAPQAMWPRRSCGAHSACSTPSRKA
jgi:hypothetical protein